MNFEIVGKIIPYTRVTDRSKRSERAKIYFASQNAVRLQLQAQMSLQDWTILPGQTPLSVQVRVYQAKGLHKCDLDNIVKALLDAAQGTVFENDFWVDEINAVRWLASDDKDLCVFRIGKR